MKTFFAILGAFLPGILAAQYPSRDTIYDSLFLTQTELSFKKEQHYYGLGRTYEAWAEYYERQLGYNVYTLDYLLKCTDAYLMSGDSFDYYRANILVGDYYQEEIVGNPDANLYYGRALRYFEKNRHLAYVIRARKGMMLSRIINNTDPYIEKDLESLLVFAKNNDLAEEMGEIYHFFVVHYFINQRLDAALPYIKLGLNTEYTPDFRWLSAVHLNYMGYYLKEKGQARAAIAYLLKGQKIAEQQKSLLIQKDICKNLAGCYRALGQMHLAFDNAQRAFELTDSLHNSSFTKNARLIEPRSRINRLELEKQLAEEENVSRRRLAYILGLSVLLLLFVAMLLWAAFERQKLRAKARAEQDKNRINALEIKAMQALITGQESERRRIARELHDGAGAYLSRIKMLASPAAEPTVTAAPLPQIGRMIDEVCTEIRHISAALSPVALQESGLMTAVEEHIRRIRLTHPTAEVHFFAWGNWENLPEEWNIHLFRMVQELLNNALKYAQARHITVQMSSDDTELNISVEDDGVGFDPPTAPKGQGLRNVQVRAACLQGQVHWETAPGKGTQVMITLPRAFIG